MRPIKLKINAFGSYAGENVIDFDKLGTDGLYLITGVTGAGKSTVFDAITYALYGEISEKQDRSLRSRYAEPNADTAVELEFEYKGKKYSVRRNPTYMRQKKRGGGMSEQKAAAMLTLPDGTVIEKISLVNNEIENILGVTKDQFKQTVMIEQGKFRELLTADTKTRKEILRSIFNMYIYNNFQEKLGTRAAAAKAEFEKRLAALRSIAESVKCGEDTELSGQRDMAASGELSKLGEFEKLLGRQNSEDASELEKLNVSLAETEAKILEINGLITRGKKQKELRGKLEAAQKDLPEIKKEAAEKAEQAKLTKDKFSLENEQLNQKIGALQNKLSDYDTLEKNRAELKKLEKRVKENTDAAEKAAERLEKLKKEHERFLAESGSLENAGANIEKLTAKINECRQRSDALKKLKEDLASLDSVRGEYDSLQKKYIEAQSNSDNLQMLALGKRKSFNDEQAGIIAETLRDNEPCPVCGSAHHPALARKTAGAPTKEEVEAAGENAEKARKKAEELSSGCNAKKSVIAEKEENISKKLSDLIPDSKLETAARDTDSELDIIKNNISELSKELDTETRNRDRKTKLSKLISENETDTQKIQKDIEGLNTSAANDDGSMKKLREQIDVQSKTLTFPSKKDAEAHISELREKIKDNDFRIEEDKKAAEQCDQRLQRLTAEIETHTKQLSSEKTVDIEKSTLEMEQYNAEKTRINRKLDEIKLRINDNQKAAARLTEISAELVNADRENTLIQSLADTARGKTGAVKTDLESFVQTRFLDRILQCANKHLRRISNGQYDLIRRKNIETSQGQHTLDLDVKDYYNGTHRDVSSLSGGESFIASLALALGLSDTVQQRSGGVRLDTMFIDEGFGTLSPEYLDKAMSVLRSLTESDRLIGIISHVEEIKRLIPKRIEVTKDGSKGSKAQVIV